jgi:hypothetical protein
MKPTLKILGEDGNIFNLLAIAKKRFRELNRDDPEAGWNDKWQDFLDDVQNSGSYDEALVVFMDYFDVE